MRKPLIIGLTGGIGMGKSTVAKMLRAYGLPLHDADAVVHALLGKGGAAVAKVAKKFPESLKGGAIDRAALGRAVFGQPEKLKVLEGILHPLVQKAEEKAIKEAAKQKAKAVILDIPLLFETGAEARCDVVLCVTAPRAVQKERVMRRPGMTEERYRAIVKRQMSEKAKRDKADHMIANGGDLALTQKKVLRILKELGV